MPTWQGSQLNYVYKVPMPSAWQVKHSISGKLYFSSLSILGSVLTQFFCYI